MGRTEPESPRLALAVDALPVVLAAWLAWRVVGTMVARRDYGFDLEWMEGGMLGHAWQLVNGRPMYSDPRPDHVAYVYPPGYPAVLAALEPWFGLEYAVGRSVSIASTLAGTAALVVAGWRQSGSWGLSLCAGGLYLSLFNASGGFYDLVRPDALGIAFLGWSLVFGLERGRGTAVASGLLLACAFAVKHNLAIFGVPVLLFQLLLVSREAAARFAAASIGPALAFTLWMQAVSGGNFLAFIVGLPASHGMSGARAFPGTPIEFSLALLPGLIGAALVIGLRVSRRVPPAAMGLPLILAGTLGLGGPGVGAAATGPGPAWWAHVGLAALGAIAGSLAVVVVDGVARRSVDERWLVGAVFAGVAYGIATLMRAHLGGFVNVLMPLHWVTCLALVVVAGRARVLWPTVGPGLSAAFAAWALLWSGGQLELERLVPTPQDRAAGERVVEDLRGCPPGPILSPYAAWLPVQAGREPSAHLIGLWDIDHKGGPFEASIAVFEQLAAQRYWACVVVSGSERLEYGIGSNYRLDHKLDLEPGELLPKTGWRARPTAVWTPR